MAKLPTPEEKARTVLEIYKHFKRRPGEAIQSKSFASYAASNGVRTGDISDGLEYAYEQGWIEEGPNQSHRLTEKGFEEVPE